MARLFSATDTVTATIASPGGIGTIAVRARVRWQSADSTDRYLWQITGAGSDSVTFERYLDNNLYCGWFATSTDYRTTTADVAGNFRPGAWRCYFFSWDNGAAVQTVHADHVQIASRAGAFNVASVTSLTIGRSSNGASGDLQDWILSSVAFNAKDRADFMAGVPPRQIRGITNHFPLTGRESPERCRISGIAGTITGTLPAMSWMPSRRRDYDANSIAAAAANQSFLPLLGVGD